MAYEVTIDHTVECPTAVAKANTTRDAFPTVWPPLLDQVWQFLGANPGLRSDGHNVMLYRAGAASGEIAVEVGVQVTRSFDPAGEVVPSVLPATETATTVHTGPITEIGAAHEAVTTWCAGQQRDLTGTSWEIYGDPEPGTGHFDVTVHWELA